jgi:GcrA cell cycle regulator
LGLLTESAVMTSAIWTPENTRRLIAFWREGQTAAWIASALGSGVSRCAVLGKVYRLGLARGPQARRARPASPPLTKGQREEISVSRSAPHRSRQIKVEADAAHSTATIATPPGPTTTILAVGFGQCRWPYGCSGEAGFGLCGRVVARGAFCAAHAEIGYQKRPCSAESLMRIAGVNSGLPQRGATADEMQATTAWPSSRPRAAARLP